MTDPDPTPSVRFQVLALDGGGLRGIFSAACLDKFEQDNGRPTVDCFDLMTGTSTGGLIALGLAAGLGAEEILRFYLDRRNKIFPQGRRHRTLRHLRPYAPNGLRDAVTDIFEERTLADSKVRLAIPSFDLNNNQVHLFRTPHRMGLNRDHRERFVDVAMATTAAPTYLPVHLHDGHRLVDGGVWANNPAMVGVVEATVACKVPLERVHLLSIGTTGTMEPWSPKVNRGPSYRWARRGTELLLTGQALTARNHAWLLLGADDNSRAVRCDVTLGHTGQKLDKVEPGELIGQARSATRDLGPKVAPFYAHHAAPWVNLATGAR